MTDTEIQDYVGRQVELKLKSGVTLTGELVAGVNAILTGAPYAVKTPHESATLGVSEPTYTAIPNAQAVEWCRILEAPISDERLED